MQSTLAELTEKRNLREQQTVFMIERFVACRRTTEPRDSFVDVTSEGMFIALRNGASEVAGFVTSKHISDRSGDFRRTWFA